MTVGAEGNFLLLLLTLYVTFNSKGERVRSCNNIIHFFASAAFTILLIIE